MIWIFGDSFSTNDSNASWTQLLGKPTTKISQNGISEYRILQNIKQSEISDNDTVIICHTNPHRVYIPDSILYPARKEENHKHCDLVISDSMNRNFLWRTISKVYFKYFFNERHSLEIHNLIIKEQIHILKGKTDKIIEVSGFSEQTNSFYDIFVAYAGKVNHMDNEGNRLVADRIRKLL